MNEKTLLNGLSLACVLGLATAIESVAIPFNDRIEFAADLGSESRLHRMSDPRVATIDYFEYDLGISDPLEPLDFRTGSLWFKWTAPVTGRYHVAGLEHDDLMDVYRSSGGNPGNHIPLNGSDEVLSFSATAGEAFFIRHMGRFSWFGGESSPFGFILRQEQTSHVTDFGVRNSLAANLTSFGAGNAESYRWTVTEGGTYEISLDTVVFPGEVFSVQLKKNGLAVPGSPTGLGQEIILSPGDVLELLLEGDLGFCGLLFGPLDPPSTDLGSVFKAVVPSMPMVDAEWSWTAPSDGFLRLDFETIAIFESFFGGDRFVLEDDFGFDYWGMDITLRDGDCETLSYKAAIVAKVEAGMTYWFVGDRPDPFSGGFIELKFTSNPTTLDELLDAATASIDLNTDEGLTEADAFLASALALDSTHSVANALRAITRLALLEREPAFAAFLQSLNFTNEGSGLFDPVFTYEQGLDGLPVFPPTANATERIAALNALFSPRLAEIRGYLDAVSGGDNRRAYLAVTGSFVLDEADVLALKAVTNVFQALLDLLSIYNLGGSLNAIVQLERDGETDLETVLAEIPGLLTFANSAAIADFKTRISDANAQLCAALVMSGGQRVICGNHPFPPFGTASEGEDFIEFLMGMDELTEAFNGPVDIGGEIIDLSAWNASSASLRAMLPDVRGGRALGFTSPDPTLSGIFPDRDAASSPIEGFLGFADPAGFSFWIQSFVNNGLPPFLAGFNDDADGDGQSNGMEYFFGSDPNDSSVVSQGPVPEIATTLGGKKFRVSFVRRIGALDVRYIVAVSGDLVTWDYTEAAVTLVGSPTPVGDGQGEIVTVEIDSDLSESKFVRIHATAK